MSTQRYSGQLRIRITYIDDSVNGIEGYRCCVVRPDGKQVRVTVGSPRVLTHSVDSPEAFDSAAHAAIAFADDEAHDCSEFAAYTERGWHVGRSLATAWPKEKTASV